MLFREEQGSQQSGVVEDQNDKWISLVVIPNNMPWCWQTDEHYFFLLIFPVVPWTMKVDFMSEHEVPWEHDKRSIIRMTPLFWWPTSEPHKKIVRPIKHRLVNDRCRSLRDSFRSDFCPWTMCRCFSYFWNMISKTSDISHPLSDHFSLRTLNSVTPSSPDPGYCEPN